MAALTNNLSSLKLSNATNNRFRSRSVLSTVSVVAVTRRRLMIVATETDLNEGNAEAPNTAPSKGGSSLNQLLGIRGAAQEKNKWKIRLQLAKPVTWPPLVWGVVCGAAASGACYMRRKANPCYIGWILVVL